MSDLAALTHHDFTPHAGSIFSLTADDAVTVSLELSVSLLFIADPDAPSLSQRLYHLDHAGLGALDLFLVPIGPKNGAMQYEAIFN